MERHSLSKADLEKHIETLEKKLKAYQDQEKDFWAIVDNSPDILYRTDMDGKITFISPSSYRLSGYTLDEAIGMDMANQVYYRPEERIAFLNELRSRGEVSNFVAQLKRKDGSLWWASTNAHFLKDRDGNVVGVEGITRDISSTMEKDLELQRIFSMSLDIICTIDLENETFSKINPAFTEILGYPVEEYLQRAFSDIIHEEDIPATAQMIENRLKKGEKVLKYRTRCICKSGDIRWLSWVFQPQLEKKFVYSIARDITDEVIAADALMQSERQFRNVVESSPMGVHLYEVRKDKKLLFTGANRAADRILHLDNSKFIGLTLEEAFPTLQDTEIPEIYRAVGNMGVTWQDEQVEYEGDDISGAYEVHAFQTSPGKIAVFFFDISERKKAEEEKKKLQSQLQQAQKMEAIGTLAGGIAHDFNNILMGIQGRISLALLNQNLDSSLSDHLENIEKYIKIAVDLTQQLLGFARVGKYEVRAIDINNLVATSAGMFGRTKKEIQIHQNLEDDLWNVEGAQQQLHQVLLNLYVNAWQAMTSGGDLYLKTNKIVLDEGYTQSLNIIPGPYVKITVSDTGVGMAPEVREKIFEPFFTTKAKGRGTGLGLASAYGIIKNHGGIIVVDSEVGVGSTFEIYLPSTTKEVERQASTETAAISGRERILLVDDEEIVLEVGSEMLKNLGYEVHCLSDGRAAIEYYSKTQSEIDLVILDMIMPGIDGSATFDGLKEVNPDVNVLLSSGYSIDGKANEILSKGCRGFIQKPFSLEALSKKIRSVLD